MLIWLYAYKGYAYIKKCLINKPSFKTVCHFSKLAHNIYMKLDVFEDIKDLLRIF